MDIVLTINSLFSIHTGWSELLLRRQRGVDGQRRASGSVKKGVLALTHTEVPEEFEGKGMGSALVKKTFEIIQEENLKIVAACPFVAGYLKRHPEYQSLVASSSE